MAGGGRSSFMPVILFAAALISMLWFQGQAVTHAQEHTFETLRISAQDQTLIFNDRLEKQFDVLSVLALSLSQNEDISADALYSLLRETGGLTNFSGYFGCPRGWRCVCKRRYDRIYWRQGLFSHRHGRNARN